MTDDEIRERAFGFVRKNADNWSADDIDNLASLLASERAAALGAAGDGLAEFADRQRGNGKTASYWRGRLHREADRIRSISPESWIGVRARDLAIVKEAAVVGADRLKEIAERGVFPEAANQLATAIRAALARLP